MLKKDLYNARFAILLIIIYWIIMQTIFGTVCPLKAFIGITCPACGLTHATIYLLTLNFKQAFNSNPTVLLWLITLIFFTFDRYIHKLKFKIFPYLFIIVGIITIVWYFCANFLILK
jgi:hypothetical protein